MCVVCTLQEVCNDESWPRRMAMPRIGSSLTIIWSARKLLVAIQTSKVAPDICIAKLAALAIDSMRGGGRDSPYIPHEGRTGHSPTYPNPSLSASMSCWPSVPLVFSVPASHAEMYYVPQPMGLPTAAIPPYAWPLYACQQPIYPAIEPWQGPSPGVHLRVSLSLGFWLRSLRGTRS